MNTHINELIKAMKLQFNHMRTDYANQLNAIESEFERERAALLSKNDDEIKALFKQHKEVEEKFLRLKADQEEEQSRQLENLRSQDANN
jgi:outer membrane translocation and assembly module TamA